MADLVAKIKLQATKTCSFSSLLLVDASQNSERDYLSKHTCASKTKELLLMSALFLANKLFQSLYGVALNCSCLIK